MDKLFYTRLYWACDYLSMLGLKLIHVVKGGPGLKFSLAGMFSTIGHA